MLDKIKELFQKQTTKQTYLHLPSDQVDVNFENMRLVPYETYFRIWVAEANLSMEREWFKDWFPAVQGTVKTYYASQETSFTKFVGVTKEFATDGVALNYPLTPLLPFQGGDIEVSAVLLAFQGNADLLGMSIKILESFGSLVTAPLQPAIGIAHAVSSGVNELIETINGQPQLYFQQTYGGDSSSNPLHEGYLIVILSDDELIDLSLLHVKGGRVMLANNNTDELSQFSAYEYILLRVEITNERDDWTFPEIEKAWKKAREAIFDPMLDNEQKKLLKRALGLAIVQSDDLTLPDKRRVYDYILNDIRKWENIDSDDERENTEYDVSTPPKLDGLTTQPILGNNIPYKRVTLDDVMAL